MQNEPRLPRWPWAIGLTLLLATALGAGWFLSSSPAGGDSTFSEKDKGAPVPPVTVCMGFVDTELGVAKLHPLVPGRVQAVVAEGTEVKKGDVLLKLDRQIAESKLSEAGADLAAAQVTLQQAEKLPEQYRLKKEQQMAAVEASRAQREAANQKFQGELKSFEQNGTIGLAFKKAQEAGLRALDEQVKAEQLKLNELTVFDSKPQADINRAKADVQAKMAKMQEAEFALRECNLVAPCDGSVLRVFTQAGESSGTTPVAPAIQFCPKGPKIIRAEVLQEWAYRVEPGQEVTIVDDTYAAATWQGRVKKVSEWFAEKRQKIYEPFMLNDVRTLECLIEVTSEGRPLRIGQRVRVRIQQKAS